MRGLYERLGDRRLIDRTGLVYISMVVLQTCTISLYEFDRLPHIVAWSVGLVTALFGPLFSLGLCLHIFAHRRPSRRWNIPSLAMTYVVTCASYAILYALIDGRSPDSFSQPP